MWGVGALWKKTGPMVHVFQIRPDLSVAGWEVPGMGAVPWHSVQFAHWHGAQFPDMVQSYLTWHTVTWHGAQLPDLVHRSLAWHTVPWHRTYLPDIAHISLIWHIVAWHGAQLPDMAHSSLTYISLTWHTVTWHGAQFPDMVHSSLTWCTIPWYGAKLPDMAQSFVTWWTVPFMICSGAILLNICDTFWSDWLLGSWEKYNFQTYFAMNIESGSKYTEMCSMTSHGNIGLGNGLDPSATKSLPEPMLTKSLIHYCVTQDNWADYKFAPSQWETVLLCNDVSHWLGASLQSALG